ncbi:MAG: M20/M25/M40 family metallo-hydrolase [Blastocatellia bacterium]|nr:M20/M25/M40 family metallo-hydrolase [Blastocatellia bacterium]
MKKISLCIILLFSFVGQAVSQETAKPRVPIAFRAVLARISADSLRGHLSFIASDQLEGRKTPSRGLDLAAEYIAAQFRRAALEPAGEPGKSYFQVGSGQKNVIGLLRGSDPVLRDTYVIISAHYDHLGIGEPVNGDSIYNGANDDGSGTVSVVEIASALASMKPKPKRSIVFIAWSGEEQGLDGSRYYGNHPVFPLEKTVAMVNLELVGRTDSLEGKQINSASMTGFDFTDMGRIFRAAGRQTGIRVYKDEKNSDPFFSRSDNQALADAGVPAHTLCVAFEYADYHQPSDQWEKIDYENMARVDRMIALALINIANSRVAPKWNAANPLTEKYVKAWKALHNGTIDSRQ